MTYSLAFALLTGLILAGAAAGLLLILRWFNLQLSRSTRHVSALIGAGTCALVLGMAIRTFESSSSWIILALVVGVVTLTYFLTLGRKHEAQTSPLRGANVDPLEGTTAAS